MTQPRRSPTLRRRRLSALLRDYRQARGLTAVQVDRELGWTPGKVARIERREWQRPNLRDMKDLLDLYEVVDEAKRDEVLTLARQGRERGWWHPYREMISEVYTTYIGLEAEAAAAQTFEPLIVPGLLQTEEYARAVLRNGPAELTEEEIEQRVAIRAQRQQLLTDDRDPLRLWAVLDEAVLHRLVGGSQIMAAQLQHIIEITALPKVTVQVVPYAQGAHPGVAGAFTILEFSERDPDAVYAENIAGELLVEVPEDVARFKLAAQRLQGLALSPGDSLAMIDATRRQLT